MEVYKQRDWRKVRRIRGAQSVPVTSNIALYEYATVTYLLYTNIPYIGSYITYTSLQFLLVAMCNDEVALIASQLAARGKSVSR